MNRMLSMENLTRPFLRTHRTSGAQGYLHDSFRPQLPGHRAEDAGSNGLVLGVMRTADNVSSEFDVAPVSRRTSFRVLGR